MKYCAVFLFVCLCSLSLTAWAEGLQDPTRPPAGIGGGTLNAGIVASPPARGLRSVIISPSRCAAIIDGKTVELGARHGNDLLVEIGEQGVVLMNKSGQRRVMRLYPAVGMKMTETLPQQKQAITCKFEQNSVTKTLPDVTGEKGKK